MNRGLRGEAENRKKGEDRIPRAPGKSARGSRGAIGLRKGNIQSEIKTMDKKKNRICEAVLRWVHSVVPGGSRSDRVRSRTQSRVSQWVKCGTKQTS